MTTVNQNALVVTTVINPFIELDNELDRALDNLVDSASGTGDVIKDFARALCNRFNKGELKWFDLRGKDLKPVNEYRTKFTEKFESKMMIDDIESSPTYGKQVRKFDSATINSYWLRVKKASGKITQARVQSDIHNVRELTLQDLMTSINRTETAQADDKNKYIDFDLVADELDVMKDMFVRLGGIIDPKTKKLSSPFKSK